MSLTNAPAGLQMPSARLTTERLIAAIREADPVALQAFGDAVYCFGSWQSGTLSKEQRSALLGRVRDTLDMVLA